MLIAQVQLKAINAAFSSMAQRAQITQNSPSQQKLNIPDSSDSEDSNKKDASDEKEENAWFHIDCTIENIDIKVI